MNAYYISVEDKYASKEDARFGNGTPSVESNLKGGIIMKKNRRFLSLLLAGVMVFLLAACGKGNESSNPSGTNQTTEQSSAQATDNTQDGDNSETSTEQSGNQMVVHAKLTGKLNLIELDDRDASILRGVRIWGESIGTIDDINGKESSLDDVRCIFSLNEWVEFNPDIDQEYGLRVWILEHRDDHEYYKSCKFSDLMPGFVTYCDLHYPVDADNPDEWYWGNFYLNPEEWEAGYYDFVFTYDGKAIATLVTRFYNDGELSGKSGSELEALMHE